MTSKHNLVFFYDIHLEVEKGVLIPRPETEELVLNVVQENIKSDPGILDIGTGSGCIAIGMASMINEANVTALEVDPGAIETARENAKLNKVKVIFIEGSVFDKNAIPVGMNFDIIVSNPPYVRESEKQEMNENVLKYEPEGALYVSDDDPLIYYRAIAELANVHLKAEGQIWVEINEYLGKETQLLFTDYGFSNVRVLNDIPGKNRFINAKR